jgi:hypothetical protein
MIQGAAAILRPEGLEEISEKLGGDLVLLPNSIHEWIVIKAVPGEDLSDQIAMVKAINADVVEPQDRLSDEVLVYEAWTGAIIHAAEYR